MVFIRLKVVARAARLALVVNKRRRMLTVHPPQPHNTCIFFRVYFVFKCTHVVDNELTVHDVQYTCIHHCLQTIRTDQVQYLLFSTITDSRGLSNGARKRSTVHDTKSWWREVVQSGVP